MPFLHELAKKVSEDREYELHDHWVILPSRRSCIYFEHYLAGFFQKPSFFPKVQTIEELSQELSGLVVPDQHFLLVQLFGSWNRVGETAISLEDFLEFGPQLLRDFDHIDANLVDAAAVFAQLQAEQSLVRWGDELGESLNSNTPLVKKQFDFWFIVDKVYDDFKGHLINQGLGYKGLNKRMLAENLDEHFGIFKGRKIHVAGFNSLSKSERKLIFGLHDRCGAELHWDSKREFIDDQDQEAGRYLREYETILGPIRPLQPGRYRKEQKIDITGVQGVVAQSRMAWSRVSEAIASVSFEDVKDRFDWLAIVLPDERMLFPLLESMPSSLRDKNGTEVLIAEEINITMGLGFSDSTIRSLLQNLFKLLEKEKKEFYYQDLFRILSSPVFTLEPVYSKKILELLKRIREEKIIQVGTELIREYDVQGKLENLLFPDLKMDPGFLEKYLDQIFKDWFQIEKRDVSFGVNKVFFLKALDVAERTHRLFKTEGVEFGFKAFSHLFIKSLDSYSIPFSSKPLKPIHIVGMLETRALDFRHLSILSCNEGILPRGRTFNSLLPFFVSKIFDLPTYEDFDSSSAYSFFRLLNEPEEIDLIYSKESNEMYRSEPSRYLLQVENFWNKKEGKRITKHYQEFDLRSLPDLDQNEIPKSDEIIERTLDFLSGEKKYRSWTNGLSPSALTQYLYNTLEFFESKILEVREEERPEVELDPMLMGTIIHGFLELPLKKFNRRTLDHHALEVLLNDKPELERVFGEVLNRVKVSKYSRSFGYSSIQVQIAKDLARDYLKNLVREGESFQIYGLEKDLRVSSEIETEKRGRVKVLLKGNLDRIDKLGEGYRIIDYKTGSPKSGELKASGIKDLLVDGGKSKILQLMMYKYLLIKQLDQEGSLPLEGFREETRIMSGIYYFGGKSSGVQYYAVADEPEDNQEFCVYWESILGLVLDQMLDKTIPFTDGVAFEKQ